MQSLVTSVSRDYDPRRSTEGTQIVETLVSSFQESHISKVHRPGGGWDAMLLVDYLQKGHTFTGVYYADLKTVLPPSQHPPWLPDLTPSDNSSLLWTTFGSKMPCSMTAGLSSHGACKGVESYYLRPWTNQSSLVASIIQLRNYYKLSIAQSIFFNEHGRWYMKMN